MLNRLEQVEEKKKIWSNLMVGKRRRESTKRVVGIKKRGKYAIYKSYESKY